MGIPKAYWLDLQNYDPVALMKETTHPTLILQGDRDYQVTQTDFNLWQEGLGDNALFTFKLYKGLNHLFMTGDQPSTPDEYNAVGFFDKEVTKDISAWILSH
ncbi:MAG: dienelactone hydrolase family protein [Vallitaleaceae bacterium]|nr:dienelactone hydrolase family protein [Vallitaleaceae bacterium]